MFYYILYICLLYSVVLCIFDVYMLIFFAGEYQIGRTLSTGTVWVRVKKLILYLL